MPHHADDDPALHPPDQRLFQKLENHVAAVAVHFMACNFVKPHDTLTKRAHGHPVTPGMEAGVTLRPWACDEVVGLLDAPESN